MNNHEPFKFSVGVIAYPILFVLVIWLVFWFEVRFGFNFSKYGIYPQTIKGLRGVLLSPFIHGSIQHIYHNTIPLFILSTAMFYFYRSITWKVFLFGIIGSGILTWLIGRPSYHIGASGLIYVLVSFTFFKGIFAKNLRLIALSLVVVFLYGSMIWYTLPIEEGISWEGHLSGLIIGFVFSLIFKKEIAKPQKYKWEEETFKEEEDPFLRHFDKEGNFIENLEHDNESDQIQIHYTFRKKEE